MALEIQVLALDRHKRGRVKPVNGISKGNTDEQTIKYLHRFAFTQKDHIPSQR